MFKILVRYNQTVCKYKYLTILVNQYWTYNLLENLNSLKLQLISNGKSDARLFLINGTNHLI